VLLFVGTAKLAGFALSKTTGSSSFTLETRLKYLNIARVGPEVVRDGKRRTVKSDIFGYGSLVYEESDICLNLLRRSSTYLYIHTAFLQETC